MKENRLIKQVFHEQKEYYSYNNSSWVSSLESMSQFYGIKLENSNNISKSRWKKAVKSAIKEKSKQIILDQADYRSKLQPLLEFRDGTNIENYMLRLPHKHARIIFLIRTRMLNLKCNQKSKFKEDLKCPRCQKELDNEKHLIEQCKAIPIKRPDNIKYEDALNSETDVEQLKIIAQFVIEVLKL